MKFNANGGTISAEDRYFPNGDAVGELPTPSKTGYTFDGWYTAADGGTKISADTKVAANATYYAHWAVNSYTIAYDANGGSGTVAPTSVSFDQDATLAEGGFTFYAKQLAGWATTPAGEVVYQPGQKVKNLTSKDGETITLYAVWEPLVVPPVECSAADGTVFCGDSRTVTLSCPLDGTVIYYTTNGVTPRLSKSFAYTSPIVLHGSAKIVAIAVKDGVKSGYTRVSVTQIAPVAPVVSPTDGTVFRSETCTVSITCDTEGAEIYYTLDGSEPKREKSTKYTASFTIADTTTVRAVAVGGPFRSEIVTVTITKKPLSLAEAAGAMELTFTTDETAPWRPIVDPSAATGFAAQSGRIGLDATSWMETTVQGRGEFSFRWRVDCESDDSGEATWDRLMVFTNGVEALRIDGVREWSEDVVFKFDDAGSHTVRWVFLKDDYDEEGSAFGDCGYVSGITWKPASVDPLPEISEAEEVSKVFASYADSAHLCSFIASLEDYAAFRSWVGSRGIPHDLVKNSANAWLAYVLDSPDLLSRAAVAMGDLLISAFAPSDTASGAFTLDFGIADVSAGDGAKPENLAAAFAVEGAAELMDEFSSDGLSVDYARTADGRIRATVVPAKGADDKLPPSFFLRVKVK